MFVFLFIICVFRRFDNILSIFRTEILDLLNCFLVQALYFYFSIFYFCVRQQ